MIVNERNNMTDITAKLNTIKKLSPYNFEQDMLYKTKLWQAIPYIEMIPLNHVQEIISKINNLENTRTTSPILNFGGQNAELWCNGGEIRFITQMIYESVKYPLQCFWFTTLVSKKENLPSIYKTLNKVGAVEIKTIDMAQGQKTSRIVAWTFLSQKQQKEWKFTTD